MSEEIIRYLVDQSSGVVIAIMLIWQVGTKLDSIDHSIADMTKQLIDKMK